MVNKSVDTLHSLRPYWSLAATIGDAQQLFKIKNLSCKCKNVKTPWKCETWINYKKCERRTWKRWKVQIPRKKWEELYTFKHRMKSFEQIALWTSRTLLLSLCKSFCIYALWQCEICKRLLNGLFMSVLCCLLHNLENLLFS